MKDPAHGRILHYNMYNLHEISLSEFARIIVNAPFIAVSKYDIGCMVIGGYFMAYNGAH